MERYICNTCFDPIERGMAHHCPLRKHTDTPPPSKGTGIRHDSGKPRISLLPGRAIEVVMQVGEFGSTKYGDHNYRGGMPITKYINAAYRHVFVEWLFKGQDTDPESGLPHLAHGAWNILAALEQMLLKPNLDDRYKGEGK